ncbi:outer membrane beta-barrel family protein [Riemerella anatipestifer]|uniref:outer membrane beta-barrel family protein n=1 Tax=Riemerella anatipestifer TaxID=34085 RepID=UPI001EB3C2FF|nr:outer membrane beta-barrel family protein [Riemerella anatipestifer]MRM83455.1 TonB-dependent receptor [Riemerella anatipestifer]
MKRLIIAISLISFGVANAQQQKQDSIEKEIQAVELKAQKKLIERKVDRLVFNVENAVSVVGGDALDALKATPSVRIQGNNIQLVGKSSVRVMINDKITQLSGEALQDYLKSIPSANILKIEVITNPPSKYEAEGNSGLINIQLKRSKQNNWSATLRSSYLQATYERLVQGANFNYKKDKFSALVDVNYSYGRNLYTNDIFYDYPDYQWNNKLFNRNHRKNWGTLLNLEYAFTDKSSLGLQFMGSFTDRYSDEFADNFARRYSDHSLIHYYKTEGLSQGTPSNISLNLNYVQKLGNDGKKLSVDADYFDMTNPEANHFTSLLQDFIPATTETQYSQNNSHQNVKNYSIKTDFEMPLSWANLSFGGRAASTKTKNLVDINFFNQDNNNLILSQKDHFEYTENIQALYFSASKSFGEKWETKVGLRGEATQTNANSISTNEITQRNYTKLFPTLYIMYKPNENHSFSANYGRRIGRPSWGSLNPARWYETPKSYTTGNPFLQPIFINNVEFNYAYKSLLNFQLFYGKYIDNTAQISRHNVAENITVMRYENISNDMFTGGSISINYKPFSWWEASAEINASYSETKPYIEIYSNHKYSGWSGYTTSRNTFTLNSKKTLFASLNYEYSLPSKGIGTMSEYSSLDIGFKYLLLNKNLILGLHFNDIFRSQQYTYKEISQGILQSFSQYYDSQYVRFSLNYKFGNNKISVSSRASGNQEEKNRAN